LWPRLLSVVAFLGLAVLAGLLPGTAGASGTDTDRVASIAEPPLLAVVGASFSAGVGAAGPEQAWPADLGRTLRWRVAVSAESGAGYLAPGVTRRGPFGPLVARLDLRRLHPRVLLIQGGHNDIGRPPDQLADAVRAVIAQARAESPGTRICVVTVFATGENPSSQAVATNDVIVANARRADPRVVVFDPLTERWQFPRSPDKLHPTAAGHEWIAAHVAAGLRAQGLAGDAA
jgi:lysophospholipase L1-like esterase